MGSILMMHVVALLGQHETIPGRNTAFFYVRWHHMRLERLGIMLFIGLLLAVAVAVLLLRCPWSACRHLNLNTHTITTFQEYRQFISNEAEFKESHHTGAVGLDCSALRDDVVTALQSG